MIVIILKKFREINKSTCKFTNKGEELAVQKWCTTFIHRFKQSNG